MRGDLASLTAFELRRAWARAPARLGLMLFTIISAAGHVDEWRGRSNGEGLFAIAYLVGLMAILCCSLAADRRLRFDAYLLTNHMGERAYLGAKIGALLGTIVLYGAFALVLEITMSGGRGIAMAVWLAGTLTLAALLTAPLAMLVEAWADTAMPAAFVLIVYVVAVAVGFALRGSTLLADFTGVRYLEPGEWASVARMALAVALFTPTAFLAAALLARLRLRRY